MSKELDILRSAADDLADALQGFYDVISMPDPDWKKGSHLIWDVDDASKELVAAAWAYDKTRISE